MTTTVSEKSLNRDIHACRMAEWYPSLGYCAFPTLFVPVSPDEISALAEGDIESDEAGEASSRLDLPMGHFFGNCFVSTDLAAPTDTERFEGKGGAVYSARSAWRFLAESRKVREAAAAGLVSHLCVRPFRRMNRGREFRLFIHRGKLMGMSQYWLTRHFSRIEAKKDFYWSLAIDFIDSVSWLLPLKNLVLDIYFTSSDHILVVDLNPWGAPTSPLLMKTWDRDWDAEAEIRMVEPPTSLNGDLRVSF